MPAPANVLDEHIFIQIAAYRDSELVPTLRDCIAQADAPEKLSFGICWQRADTDSLEEFADLDGLRLMSIPYAESRGACWARQQTQQLYQGEGFTLQIDSHHRFVPGWDTSLRRLFGEAVRRGSTKPLISSYAPAYDPDTDPNAWGSKPLRLVFDYFNKGGPVQIKSLEMESGLHRWSLERARFVSAHFLFTVGCFCEEVSYDPKTYFFGEEPSLAIRAFTHGYDLYHPCEVVLWHFYGRERHARHWSDNRKWWLRNERSLLRYRRLIDAGGESQSLGKFGLGKARSLQDYEHYAGLELAKRQVRDRTLAGQPPASGIGRWRRSKLLSEYRVEVDLELVTSRISIDGDRDRLLLTAHGQDGRQLGARTLDRESLEQSLIEGRCGLYAYASEIPITWRVTALSDSNDHGESISGPVL